MINNEASNCYYFDVKNFSELNSSGWLRSKKEAIINDDNYFPKIYLQRISKLKPYINKYNWEEIEFPSGTKDWKKFERNNKTIALNILFLQHNTEKTRVAYRSEHKNKRKRQVILLMITDGKIQHYLAVSNLSALLAKKSSNHDRDFYCFNCFNSYTTKNKLKEHEEICNNHVAVI